MYLGSILHGRDVILGNKATILVSTYSVVLLLTCAISCQVQINIIQLGLEFLVITIYLIFHEVLRRLITTDLFKKKSLIQELCAISLPSACEERGEIWLGDKPPT